MAVKANATQAPVESSVRMLKAWLNVVERSDGPRLNKKFGQRSFNLGTRASVKVP